MSRDINWYYNNAYGKILDKEAKLYNDAFSLFRKVLNVDQVEEEEGLMGLVTNLVQIIDVCC
jgi:two-component SAPR family response regulator